MVQAQAQFKIMCVLSVLVLFSAHKGFSQGTPVSFLTKKNLWFNLVLFDLCLVYFYLVLECKPGFFFGKSIVVNFQNCVSP